MFSQGFLDDLEARLVRLKSGKCVSSDLEVEAADTIAKLRAERDALDVAWTALVKEADTLRELLREWDALINYQYSGSREAMSALTEISQKTARALYGEPPWPNRIDAALKGGEDE